MPSLAERPLSSSSHFFFSLDPFPHLFPRCIYLYLYSYYKDPLSPRRGILTLERWNWNDGESVPDTLPTVPCTSIVPPHYSWRWMAAPSGPSTIPGSESTGDTLFDDEKSKRASAQLGSRGWTLQQDHGYGRTHVLPHRHTGGSSAVRTPPRERASP